MVRVQFGKKHHARVSFAKTISDSCMQFEEFEQLTGVCFFQIAR